MEESQKQELQNKLEHLKGLVDKLEQGLPVSQVILEKEVSVPVAPPGRQPLSTQERQEMNEKIHRLQEIGQELRLNMEVFTRSTQHYAAENEKMAAATLKKINQIYDELVDRIGRVGS